MRQANPLNLRDFLNLNYALRIEICNLSMNELCNENWIIYLYQLVVGFCILISYHASIINF